ncbi:MAG: hypothetical protein WDW36_007487 [Sanguina aurantia]
MAGWRAAAIRANEPPAKVARKGDIVPAAEGVNIIVQFRSATGQDTGPQLDLPASVTPAQLEILLNGLLANEDKMPYAFSVEDMELAGELGGHISSAGLSVEKALTVVYTPQAVFRVRAVARCTASMPGHSESVLAVQFSPDGKLLASGSGDTSVRLWDLATQTPQSECKGHRNWVLVVAWSPDGRVLATGDMDGAIWLWEPTTGAALGSCVGHKKWITSLAWEPAHKATPSRRFCSASRDNMIRVWDAATYRCLFSFSNHTMVVTAVRWGGEGLIYSASRDTTICVWSDVDGKQVRILKGHGHWVNTLALSTETVLRCGAFDHTGTAPKDPALAKESARPSTGVACVARVRSEMARVHGAWDDQAAAAEAVRVERRPWRRARWWVGSAAVVAAVVVGGWVDAKATAPDPFLRTPQRCPDLPSPAPPAASTTALMSRGSSSRRQRSRPAPPSTPRLVSLGATTHPERHARTLTHTPPHTRSTRALSGWGSPGPLSQAALARYAVATGGLPERLVSGSDDFTMFLWQPSTQKAPLQRMTGHVQLINQVQFSPDGRMILSASFDKSIKLWDGFTGTFLATLRGHVGPVYQVAWSSDSRLFVSGSKDSTLKHCSRQGVSRHNNPARPDTPPVTTPLCEASLCARQRRGSGAGCAGAPPPSTSNSVPHDPRCGSLARVRPSPRFTGDLPRPLVVPTHHPQVWDAHSRKLKVDLPGHADEVFTVDWAPDGSGVASGGKDRVLKLWRT